MKAPAPETLWELALGTLAPDEAREVEALVTQSPGLQAELSELRELMSSLASELPAPAPSPSLRDRLMASVGGVQRFAPLTKKLADFLDLGVEKAWALLEATAGTDWLPGPFPGTELMQLPTGPALAGVDAGFIRLKPGTHFPMHSHIGKERTLVLEGGYKDLTTGVQAVPGGIYEMAKDSSHEYVADDDGDCLGVVLLYGGITVKGEDGSDIVISTDGHT